MPQVSVDHENHFRLWKQLKSCTVSWDMQNSTWYVNFASFPCLSPWFSTTSLATIGYQNFPLVNGKTVGRFRIEFKHYWGSLEQDFSNRAIFAKSPKLPLTKTFTVGFKHLGFQKFQLLTLSTFQGQEDDVSITSLAPLQLLQTVLGR